MSSRFMDVLFYLFELFLTYFSFYFNPFLLENTFQEPSGEVNFSKIRMEEQREHQIGN